MTAHMAIGPLGLALTAVLAAIGLLHLSWAFGAVWPAADEARLVALTIGRTRTGRMPSRGMTLLVAGAIVFGGALVALVSARILPPALSLVARLAYVGLTAVFALRGLSVFAPAVWRYAEGTPFHSLNRRYYSPLCLLIAAGLTANLLIR